MKKNHPEDPDSYFVKLICGKARVTLLKGTTAPRSELSGLLILSRLLKVVVNALTDKPSQITIATDSRCSISALEKSGGILAPFFASRVSETYSNLSEMPDEVLVHPVQHVPGDLNPADIPTRAGSAPDDVREGSVWQGGPSYLALPRTEWPFSRNFLDCVPDQELRTSKATFNLADPKLWASVLGARLDSLVTLVMERSNCYAKTVNVTARLLKCLFAMDLSLIHI